MRAFVSTLRRAAHHSWICRSCQQSRSISATTTARKLPNTPARTRFAPSPTGYLHLGSLRTALFNYLLARATGGQFLLRIEDTDQKRTIADAEDRLFRDLEWAGIEWDEGPKVGGEFGPYKQSERTAIYREHTNSLLESGHAYRCFCTPDRLRALAEQRNALGLPTDYDRNCAHVTAEESADRAAKGEAHVVRLKVPSKYPEYQDIVYGRIRSRVDTSKKALLHPAFEDPILLKSDGFPTYHLANVVDDHLMKITHVVRGAEWMSSTPKHVAMYQAFGWEPPAFAHVGLLVDKDRQKLSKRKHDIDISSFRETMGIFPETLTNYVALLGWSHGQRKDIMGLRELVDNFSMKFTTGETIVTPEKLWYLQRAHAERYAQTDAPETQLMVKAVEEYLKSDGCSISMETFPKERDLKQYAEAIVKVDARNYTKASEFIERNRFFFERPSKEDRLSNLPLSKHHHVPKPATDQAVSLEDISSELGILSELSAEEWTAASIRKIQKSVIEKMADESMKGVANVEDTEVVWRILQKSWSKIVHAYVRWAITGGKPGPDGAESMYILGQAETLQRLRDSAECAELVESGLERQ